MATMTRERGNGDKVFSREYETLGDLYAAMGIVEEPNDETLDAIEETNDPARRRRLKVYSSPSEFFADLGI